MRQLFFALFAIFCLSSIPAEAVTVPIVCYDTRAEALTFIPDYTEVGNGSDYHSNQFHLYLAEDGRFAIAFTMLSTGAYCFIANGDEFVLQDMSDPANVISDYGDTPYAVFGHGSIPDTNFELEIHVEQGPAQRFYIVVYDEKTSQVLVIGLMWESGIAEGDPAGSPV